MNDEFTQPQDQHLNDLLTEWKLESPLPPRFAEQVWKRISHEETPIQPAFLDSIKRLLEAVIPRPKVAFSYVAILLIAGVAAGSWTAQKQNNREQASLQSDYLLSVDPYRMTSSGK